MSVRPADLENQERDLALETRDARPPASTPAQELEALLRTARDLVAVGELAVGVRCGACWTNGRDAAVGHLEGGRLDRSGLRARLKTARDLKPGGSGLHDGASWARGRDAVLEHVANERG